MTICQNIWKRIKLHKFMKEFILYWENLSELLQNFSKNMKRVGKYGKDLRFAKI